MSENLNHVLEQFKSLSEYKEINNTLGKRHLKDLPVLVTGLSDGASVAFCASMIKDRNGNFGPALIVVSSEKEMFRLASAISEYEITAQTYNVRDFVLRPINSSHEFEQSRIAVLHSIIKGKCDAVITTPDALMQYTVPKDLLTQSCFEIRSEGAYDLADLCNRLVGGGYKSVEMVDAPGQFSRRGGILDVFTPGMDVPCRIEFWDEDVDHICTFDVLTQRRVDDIDLLNIMPVREVILTPDKSVAVAEYIQKQMKKSKGVSRDALYQEYKTLCDGRDFLCADKYLDIIYPEQESLLDYFHKDALILVQNYNAVRERAEFFETQINEDVLTLQNEGMLFAPNNRYFMNLSLFESFLKGRRSIFYSSYTVSLPDTELLGIFSIPSKGTTNNSDAFDLFLEDYDNYASIGYDLTIACDSDVGVEVLRKELADYDESSISKVKIVCAPLAVGFEIPSIKLALISFAKGSNAKFKKSASKKRFKKLPSEKILSYQDLSVGDYIVHENHGIGRYLGVESMTVIGVRRDYVKLQYAGTDTLYLPCDQLDKLSKYIGATDTEPVKLSKMGGQEWKKTKSRVKTATKEMAKELINLYAARLRKKGYAFSKDDAITKEFADSFEFEETDGQLQAISEITRDMESFVPMDRLLCGDVGYGKTEVALRAVFKAVMDSKQVAILVPTTILAMQHYQTILSRMRGFPVKAEMISRFRNASQQNKILRSLARGEVDILVGTHRILSKDVEFKDLGLLIIDEEQRFGVAQKEKLKAIAENVDTLVLTATPIPRTLNMAMSGIRDMSVLEEAPGDRLPVQTFVLEYNESMIIEAVRKELRRGGQVFYLCNDIEKFPSIVQKLSLEFPDANIATGNGQMDKDDLSEVWQSMVDGDTDILVCTTIIETGIDVPNANTIIVENADRMGLSQLHQIRGRVGRSSRRAYAYLTYPKGKVLGEIPAKRLDALRDFTEFGAGFKIAIRDLEIRGAGNLLGAQQHGHLISVGYEMYMRLLNEAILEEKGEAVTETVECAVNVSVDAYIPESYIGSSSARIDAYRKISLIRNNEDMLDIMDELIDRYGNAPLPVSNLLNISLIRALGSKCGITKIDCKSSSVVYFPRVFDQKLWLQLVKQNNGKYLTAMSSNPYVQEKIRPGEKILRSVLKTLEEYLKLLNEKS